MALAGLSGTATPAAAKDGIFFLIARGLVLGIVEALGTTGRESGSRTWLEVTSVFICKSDLKMVFFFFGASPTGSNNGDEDGARSGGDSDGDGESEGEIVDERGEGHLRPSSLDEDREEYPLMVFKEVFSSNIMCY